MWIPVPQQISIQWFEQSLMMVSWVSYHIGSCKTDFIIFYTFISLYSSVKKNIPILLRLMNFFYSAYHNLLLIFGFLKYSNCQARALTEEFLCPFDISSSVFWHFLSFFTTHYFRLTLNISYLISGISSKGSWFLLVKNCI